MPALNVVTVDPDELAVDIDLSQPGGATVTAYTDATGATPISLPATISARTEFWLPVNADYTFIVSVGGAERYRTTVGVSDRTDDPKTLLLRDVLSLGDAAAGGGGGSGASGGWLHVITTVAFDTPGLNDGVVLYTPTIGDWLHEVTVETLVPWNLNLSPNAEPEVGTFVGTTSGLFAVNSSLGSLKSFDAASESHGTGLRIPVCQTLVASQAASQVGVVPAMFTATNPLKVVVSENGLKGGTTPDADAGSARIHVWIEPAS